MPVEPEHIQGPFVPASAPERALLRAAVIELALERGLPALTAAAICARAGVEEAAFERDFAGPEDLCRQVYAANIAEFDRIVFSAVEAAEGWPDRLRASAYAALRYVRDRPCEARFNFIEMLEGGEEAQVHRDRYVNRIVDLIDEGRGRLDDPDSLSREVAVAAFGSVYEFLQRQFATGADISDVDRHVPELMYLAVRPYLGERAALEELSIPPPSESAKEGG